MTRASESDRFSRVSRMASEISPFLAMEVMERAQALEREGRNVVHLEVGIPDFDTPEVILEAGIRAMREGHTRYTHSKGHLELREAIAAWMQRKYGLDIPTDRIVATVGSSGALLLVFKALLEPGDRVLMTDPCYPCYPNFVRACLGVPVPVPVREREGFQFVPAELESELTAASGAVAVMLNSPANPTGIITPAERLAEIARVAGGRAQLISDEVYHGLSYGERAPSILEFEPDAVVVSGFSKLFAMTGWRLGYAILPEHLARPVQKLQQNLFVSPPDFSQIAAVAALTRADDEIEHMCQAYDQRRQLVLRRLSELGLRVLVEPKGAFYVFFNVSDYTDDVLSFAFELLEQAGVAMTPGVDFGPHGEGFLRLCYASSLENLNEGLDRLQKFLSERTKG